MNRKPLTLALGLVGLMSVASSATAAALANPKLVVTMTSVDDNGGILGTTGTKTWDLTGPLWTQSTTNGHVLNDLTSTLFWKTGTGNTPNVTVNDLKFDVDPLLSFDQTFTNTSATNQLITMSYSTPMAPAISGTINSVADLNVTLSDTGGAAGAFVRPGNGGGNLLRSWDITVDGNQISKNVDIGVNTTALGLTTFNTAVNSLVCGTGTSACETMSSVLTFILSKGDTARFVGAVQQLEQIPAVPVPAAIWLFGSALAGLIGFRRKKQSV